MFSISFSQKINSKLIQILDHKLLEDMDYVLFTVLSLVSNTLLIKLVTQKMFVEWPFCFAVRLKWFSCLSSLCKQTKA